MSSWGDDAKTYEAVKGAKVDRVVADKNDAVTLMLAGGRALRLALDGDCCSSSYYTDPRQFDELIGATIQCIEERDGESREGLDAEDIRRAEENKEYRESVSWHFLVFTTDKGHVTVDWRNDSNGYYDGSVLPSLS